MDNFVFHTPTRIVFGAGSLSRLSKELSGRGFKKALLVTGKNSALKFGHLEKTTAELDKIMLPYEIYTDISPNPTDKQIETGAQLSQKTGADCVIALGGGSVMDASKILALVTASGGPAWKYTSSSKAKGAPVEKALPIITIPTLSATGSESNPIAVINNHETKEKNSISGYVLYPQLAIIDPELTLTCNFSVTMQGIIDIFIHATENYFSTDQNTPLQDGFTETIARVLLDNAYKLKFNLNDIEARTQVAWASCSAMNGFLTGRAGGWPMHAMEHAVSGLYPEISHPHGLSALLIPQLEWNLLHGGHNRIGLFVKKVFDKNTSNHLEMILPIKRMLSDLELPVSLKSLGVKENDLEAIADQVLRIKGNKEQKLLNITPMTREDILWVLKKAY